MAVFHRAFLLLCIYCMLRLYPIDALDGVYPNPYFHFPYGGPYMGILTAFALPLKIPTPGDIFIAVNFEASYSLPENETEFTFPPIIAASARQVLYDIFERKLESHGYPGRPCILRAICEGAELTTAGTGIFGDIVHLLLTKWNAHYIQKKYSTFHVKASANCTDKVIDTVRFVEKYDQLLEKRLEIAEYQKKKLEEELLTIKGERELKFQLLEIPIEVEKGKLKRLKN